MGILPHHFSCDHTQLWDFSKVKQEFLEKIYFWPFELIHLGGGFLLPFAFEFEFHCDFFDECKVGLILAHYLTEGSDNSSTTQKNLVPRFSSLREEGGILGTEAVFSFPRSFFLRVVTPLNFEKLNLLAASDTLCVIKNTNGVLSIRKVILEIKHFVVDFADGVLDATPELGHMEYIVYSG